MTASSLQIPGDAGGPPCDPPDMSPCHLRGGASWDPARQSDIDEVFDDGEVTDVVGRQWHLLDVGVGVGVGEVAVTSPGLSAALADGWGQSSPGPRVFGCDLQWVEGGSFASAGPDTRARRRVGWSSATGRPDTVTVSGSRRHSIG